MTPGWTLGVSNSLQLHLRRHRASTSDPRTATAPPGAEGPLADVLPTTEAVWDSRDDGMADEPPDASRARVVRGRGRRLSTRPPRSPRASSKQDSPRNPRPKRPSPDARRRGSSPLDREAATLTSLPPLADSRWGIRDVYKRLDDLTLSVSMADHLTEHVETELQQEPATERLSNGLEGSGVRLPDLASSGRSTRLAQRSQRPSASFLAPSLGSLVPLATPYVDGISLYRTSSTVLPGEERRGRLQHRDSRDSPYALYRSTSSLATQQDTLLDQRCPSAGTSSEMDPVDVPVPVDRLSWRRTNRRLRQLLGQRASRGLVHQLESNDDNGQSLHLGGSTTSLQDVAQGATTTTAHGGPDGAPGADRKTDVTRRVRSGRSRRTSRVADAADGVDDVHEEVLAMLECPVCRDFLQPPLKQCSNGHVVCFACWPRLSLCPACRAPFIPTASLVLDAVLRALRFPCPNREHGCALYLKMEDRIVHDKVCTFRPRGCPMSRCEWQGLPDALLTHCRSAHDPLELADGGEDLTVSFLVDRGAAALDGVPTIVYHEQRLFSLSTPSKSSSKMPSKESPKMTPKTPPSTPSTPPEGHKPDDRQGGEEVKTEGGVAVTHPAESKTQLFLFQSRYDLWRSKFFAEMMCVSEANQQPPEKRYTWEVELRSPDERVQLSMRNLVAAEASQTSYYGRVGDPATPTSPGLVHSGLLAVRGIVGGVITPVMSAAALPGVTPPAATPSYPAASPIIGLKLDLDVFNQFMEAGRYTLRIGIRSHKLHPATTPTPPEASS